MGNFASVRSGGRGFIFSAPNASGPGLKTLNFPGDGSVVTVDNAYDDMLKDLDSFVRPQGDGRPLSHLGGECQRTPPPP